MNHNAEITLDTLSVIRLHGEADFPNECCGFLFGKEGSPRRITLARPAKNIQQGDQRRRFLIDPRDYMAAERFAIAENLDFLGIYHSHPNHPADASVHDRKQAAPFFSYVIISVMDGKPETVLSWRLSDDGTFMEEESLILLDSFQNNLKSA